MTEWIIEPREPIIVRDGRPFTHQPGVMAATLPFPFPSTTAGAARSRAGSTDGVFDVAQNELPKLKKIQVRGPLLAEFNAKDEKWELLVPAPGDALLLEKQDMLRCQRLVPLKKPADALIKPFNNVDKDKLSPVGLTQYEPAKPAKRQPAFWRWSAFQSWLLRPDEEMNGHLYTREELGVQPLPQEERVHVALVRGMMVAREGALFETRGLEFTRKPDGHASLDSARRLALWLDVEDGGFREIKAGLDCLGGERRLVSWRECKPGLKDSGTFRAELSKQIAEEKACRLILLTPAFFRQGYMPGENLLAYENTGPDLSAVLVQRPQVVSGWNMEGKGGPKPTRRLAPAGSVFFLKFADQTPSEDIQSWVDHFWLNCIGDDEQLCCDGFGLAVLGTWNGEPQPMQDPRETHNKEHE